MSQRLMVFAGAAFSLLMLGMVLCGTSLAHHVGNTPDSAATALAADSGQRIAAKESDQELIERQKVCPVSGQSLGSMGKPVKVEVKGRTVFLCCAGCKKRLLADPDKYVKKLDEKKK